MEVCDPHPHPVPGSERSLLCRKVWGLRVRVRELARVTTETAVGFLLPALAGPGM